MGDYQFPRPPWAEHMDELQPGAYVDSDDALHLDLEILCLAAGFPPTELNQSAMAEGARIAWERTKAWRDS